MAWWLYLCCFTAPRVAPPEPFSHCWSLSHAMPCLQARNSGFPRSLRSSWCQVPSGKFPYWLLHIFGLQMTNTPLIKKDCTHDRPCLYFYVKSRRFSFIFVCPYFLMPDALICHYDRMYVLTRKGHGYTKTHHLWVFGWELSKIIPEWQFRNWTWMP